MGTNLERQQLKKQFGNDIKGKPIDKMSDAQVIAIQRRIINKK